MSAIKQLTLESTGPVTRAQSTAQKQQAAAQQATDDKVNDALARSRAYRLARAFEKSDQQKVQIDKQIVKVQEARADIQHEIEEIKETIKVTEKKFEEFEDAVVNFNVRSEDAVALEAKLLVAWKEDQQKAQNKLQGKAYKKSMVGNVYMTKGHPMTDLKVHPMADWHTNYNKTKAANKK